MGARNMTDVAYQESGPRGPKHSSVLFKPSSRFISQIGRPRSFLCYYTSPRKCCLRGSHLTRLTHPIQMDTDLTMTILVKQSYHNHPSKSSTANLIAFIDHPIVHLSATMA